MDSLKLVFKDNSKKSTIASFICTCVATLSFVFCINPPMRVIPDFFNDGYLFKCAFTVEVFTVIFLYPLLIPTDYRETALLNELKFVMFRTFVFILMNCPLFFVAKSVSGEVYDNLIFALFFLVLFVFNIEILSFCFRGNNKRFLSVYYLIVFVSQALLPWIYYMRLELYNIGSGAFFRSISVFWNIGSSDKSSSGYLLVQLIVVSVITCFVVLWNHLYLKQKSSNNIL